MLAEKFNGETTHDKWWFPDLFRFERKKIAVSFLLPVPFQDAPIFHRYGLYLRSGINFVWKQSNIECAALNFWPKCIQHLVPWLIEKI